MLPRLLDESERSGQERHPSLPGIRDLFGEHLGRPVNKPAPFTFLPPRPSPFSLADLGYSLPADSRPSSPADSQGWTSPRSAWSQASSHRGPTHGNWPGPYSPRRNSDASCYSLTSPPTSSSKDQFITLPPIQQPYGNNSEDIPGYTSTWRPTSSSRRAYESHSRARSTSEAIEEREARSSQASLDIASKRRHTIGSARGQSPVRFPYPIEPMPKPSHFVRSRSSSTVFPPYAQQASTINPYPSPSPSVSTPGLPLVTDDMSVSSAPSPPTSGEDAPTERRKSPAKYQCQFCGKRFNRPSSLKIHHNTHTGEKPFACLFPGCGRNFSVMSNMRRHARIHGDTFFHQGREGSAEDIPDVPSPAYSSASSTYTTPVTPHASLSRSHPSSTSSSPRLRALSNLSSASSRKESRRYHSIVHRSHPYNVSPPPSSDDDGSSLEQ